MEILVPEENGTYGGAQKDFLFSTVIGQIKNKYISYQQFGFDVVETIPDPIVINVVHICLQFTNHIPYASFICRKDNLIRCLKCMRKIYGSTFDFM